MKSLTMRLSLAAAMLAGGAHLDAQTVTRDHLKGMVAAALAKYPGLAGRRLVLVDATPLLRGAARLRVQLDSTGVRETFAFPVRFGTVADAYDNTGNRWLLPDDVPFLELHEPVIVAPDVVRLRVSVGQPRTRPTGGVIIEGEGYTFTFQRRGKAWVLVGMYKSEIS